MPKFSVIVPEHNSAAWMRKGLDSIRDQSFKDYELIIVCDRCCDNTAEIAREYSDKVLEVDFGRAGLTRNAGLDAATGEYILWMDDDDWYLHEFAFQMIAEAIDGINSEGHTVDLLCYSFIWKGQGYTQNELFRLWPAIWNKCWRREFIGANRFPDWKHSDDYGFAKIMHPKAVKNRSLFIMDTPLYYYNFMRPGSVSDNIKNGEYDNKELPEDMRDVADDYEKTLKDGGLTG